MVSFGAAKMGLYSSSVSVQGQHFRGWVACFSVSDPGSQVALTSLKIWHHLQVWGGAVTGSRILESRKTEIKVPAGLVSPKASLLGLQTRLPFHCVPTCLFFCMQALLVSLLFLIRIPVLLGKGSTLMTSFNSS